MEFNAKRTRFSESVKDKSDKHTRKSAQVPNIQDDNDGGGFNDSHAHHQNKKQEESSSFLDLFIEDLVRYIDI